MRRFNAQVFNDTVAGGAAASTPSSFDASLGLFDLLALQVIIDNAKTTGGGSGTLSVYIEHSGDGQNWWTKNAGAPFLQLSANPGETTSKSGIEAGVELSMAFVRLRLALSSADSARVRVYATARDGAG